MIYLLDSCFPSEPFQKCEIKDSWCTKITRTSSNLMRKLHDLISDISPNNKSNVNGSNSQRFQSYGYPKFRTIWTLRGTSGSSMRPPTLKIQQSSPSFLFALHSHTIFLVLPHTRKCSTVAFSDNVGKLCVSPWPIHWSDDCSCRYSITCLLKCGGGPIMLKVQL